jgi:hypothetical protein
MSRAAGLVRSTREAALEELTSPESGTLSPAKLAVLGELASGSSVSAAAQAGGVHRRTVANWMRNDPEFVAALNAWRNQTVQWTKDQLVATLGDAAATVREAVRNGDAKLAMQLLQLQQMVGPVVEESETAEEVQMRRSIRRRRRRLALVRQESITAGRECAEHPTYKEFRKRQAQGLEKRSWFEFVAEHNREMKLARQGLEAPPSIGAIVGQLIARSGQKAAADGAAAKATAPAGCDPAAPSSETLVGKASPSPS